MPLSPSPDTNDTDAETDRMIELIEEMKTDPKPLIWIIQQAAEATFQLSFLMAFIKVCKARMTLEQYEAERTIGLIRSARARYAAWRLVRQTVLKIARKSMDPDFLNAAWQHGYISWYHFQRIKAKIEHSDHEDSAAHAV